MTSFQAHPGLEYFPTVIEIQVGSGTAVVGGLESRDGRFRQTIGFDTFDGTTKFARANYLSVGNDYFVSYERLATGPTSSISQTFNHSFQFTQNRVDRQISDTGLTFRPGNRWLLVTSFGLQTPVGDNPSMSFLNLTAPPRRQGNVNFLRLDGESGAVVVCVQSPAICGVKGVGDFDGIYGTALSVAPGTLGVAADAASQTILTDRDPSVAPNPPACPSGQRLPPPRNLIAVFDENVLASWDSVECARGYVMRLEDERGNISEITTFVPNLTLRGGRDDVRLIVSVAAFGQDGVLGTFTQPILAIRLTRG